MGGILNPSGGNSFVNLAEARTLRVFVDKTDFIERTNNLIKAKDKFIAVTRPRRFGKTVTAHMLSAYYSKGYAGQNIFGGLKISNSESFAEHLHKYDVIYIDLNSVKDGYNSYKADKSLYVDGVDDIVDFLQFMAVRELKTNKDFAEQIESDPMVGKKSFSSALKAVCSHTGGRFVFIMDEWDLIFREYRDEHALQEKFIEVLRGLFKSDAGQACFALAYLTGILPIKKYNSQSALNVFKEYNMLNPEPYEKYFGFTEEEVAEIVNSPICRLTHQELKEWYEGYKLNGTDIYNPNSVASAVGDGKCKSYWSGTSSNEEVVRLVNMDFDGIKEDIVKMIEGGKVSFDCSKFQNDMVSINDKNDALSLLVSLGYLGCSDTNSYRKAAYVPNLEIKIAMTGIVRSQNWCRRMETVKRSQKLLKAMLELDGETTASIIEEIHNSPAVSLLAYNDEESLTYCVMTGLLWSTLDDYGCHREDQAGKGRVDLVYEPIIEGTMPLILIEFKRDSSAEDAVAQIKNKEYFRRYEGQYRNIIIAGISYSSKTKEHQCLIEKLG